MRQKRRTPRHYDGIQVTTHTMRSVLFDAFVDITKRHQDCSDLIIGIWPQIIGEKLSPMTQAVSFVEGVLTVKVKNSTLHSLLNQHEKVKILQAIRQKFPHVSITNIIFRIG